MENMKHSTKDQIAGQLHQLNGKVKEVFGIINDNPDQKTEGKIENTSGKVQEKIGQVEKVIGK